MIPHEGDTLHQARVRAYGARSHPTVPRKNAEEASTLRIWLLGGFRVSVDSRTIDEASWRLRKARSLIKLLAGRNMTLDDAVAFALSAPDPEPTGLSGILPRNARIDAGAREGPQLE